MRARCSTACVRRWALVLGLFVAIAGQAHATAIIALVPDNPGPYSGNETIQVDVFIRNPEPFDLLLWAVQLDFNDTSGAIDLPPTLTWLLAPAGSGNPNLPVPLWTTTAGPQNTVPALGTLHIAKVAVRLPRLDGCYVLDVMNADELSSSLGAYITFGPIGGALTTWRASTGDLTGGQLWFGINVSGQELCNGEDDDCDGQVDEGFEWPTMDPDTGEIILVGPGNVCFIGEGDCNVQGRTVCSPDGTELECIPVEPVPPPGVEGPPGDPSCFDMHDNDCDGLADHLDPDCQGPELCDGFDNNNNGQVDELWPELGQVCTAGVGLCEKQGIYVCSDDGTGTKCTAEAFPPTPEGPPDFFKCEDGLDNDCDGLVDLADPDCQRPETCDGKDNDGDGQIDEDFPDLGDLCEVGVGECSNFGVKICSADGTGTICSASPKSPKPEGPAGCDCADGLDNDCDGLIDLDDPDCGSAQLRVQAALVPTCGPHGDNCTSWHTVDYQVLGGQPGPTIDIELVALDLSGAELGVLPVALGDSVRLTSNTNLADLQISSVTVDWDDAYTPTFVDCLTGPDAGPLAAGCGAADTDCDADVDLKDYAAYQLGFGQTVSYHEMVAPVPMLRVTVNDGLNEAVAYASNVPFLDVVVPDKTVVSLSEGDVTRYIAAIPNMDPASLFLKIDGVDILAALGLNPATDFPGGPYGGTVSMPSGCVAQVCDLIVDSAPVDTLASNTLTMRVENLCCGGHVTVLKGNMRPGSYPDVPAPLCAVDDLTDKGFSEGFSVEITTPLNDSIDPAPPTLVLGEVCSGRLLPTPTPSAGGFVKLNGGLWPLSLPVLTPGDGENSADTYRYDFEASLSQTNMFQDLVQGIHVPGTLDPGGNRLIAEVKDGELNTTYDNVYFAVGPVQSKKPADKASPVSRGLTLALTASGLDTVVTTILKATIPGLITQEVQQWIGEMNGKKFTFSTPVCDPTITIFADLGSFSFDTNLISYSVVPSANQVDVKITAPPATAAVNLLGYCKITFLGICIAEISVDVTAKAEVQTLALEFTATEADLLNDSDIVPTLVLNPNDVDVSVLVNNVNVGCIAGFIFDIISLFVDVEDVLTDIANAYIANNLDISSWLDMLQLPPIPINFLNIDPVDINALNIQLALDKSEVEIDGNGLTVGFETTFTPLVVDPEVTPLPGWPHTSAPLAVPPIPLANEVSAFVSDDAINELMQALALTGMFKTEFEDVRQISDLLPANCGTLPPEAEGQCTALKGLPCAGLVGDAFTACVVTQGLANTLNLGPTTPILLHARAEVPPKLYLFRLQNSTTAIAFLRLSQVFAGIVADRDGDGMFSGIYNSIPTCFSAIPSSTTECALWGTCLDTNLEITLALQNGPGGVPQLNFTVTDLELSTGTGCTGGTATPGGSDVFEEIAQGQALMIIQDAVTNNVPPIRLDGLDFEGIITLQNLKLLMIENAGDPNFEDYIGITADPAP